MNLPATRAKLSTSVKFARAVVTPQCGAPSALSHVSMGSLRRLRQIVIWVLLIASTAIALSSKPAQASAFQYEYCTLSCSASAPATGTAGAPISMTGSSAGLYCDGEPNYQWDFGDNTSSSQQTPTHTYANPGTYNWTMKASIGSTTCTREGRITINARTNTLASVSAASYTGSRLASESIVAASSRQLRSII